MGAPPGCVLRGCRGPLHRPQGILLEGGLTCVFFTNQYFAKPLFHNGSFYDPYLYPPYLPDDEEKKQLRAKPLEFGLYAEKCKTTCQSNLPAQI